ncbi:PP2C family protein-serine/threonine phosphatase [Actinomarinicola tropica]|uniref:SpoIIE family protein phosphatase n=1 Tax=Actinomarinicola tropica TaxID=2789776 RepID=A0A5Q2REB4_9ACTN|nr:PP2C family protein-serine/threonine phosphatase [Actinomarinicola tropica]QGG95248.1 SpoIIE family protein phosphatase [Actinomarinicola tropica]
MEDLVLAAVAVSCAVAAVVWGRSASHRGRVLQRVERSSVDPEMRELARSDYRKDLHTAGLYGSLALSAALAAVAPSSSGAYFAIILVPVLVTAVLGRRFVADAKLAQTRLELERRAQEVIDQEDTAPKRWAARLAPDELPDITGFEVGRVYQAGTGLMAGDFYDLFRVAPTRVAAVIGDVTGHGIEPSITAFQAKYLLRTFLKQFRDPAQALEELNAQMAAMDRGEEFISLAVVVFDTEAGTLRYASAGHPPAWLWHEREVSPLRATGPLLMLDPKGTYYSREIRLDDGDMALLYTDGLAEARNGDQMFGEDRVATIIRRDPGAAPDVLCKSLLEAARDFSEGPIEDDVAILAVRRA